MPYLTVKLERDYASYIRVISAEYNPIFRQTMQEIPGREYVNNKKYWRIPIGSIDELLEAFRINGIDFEFDQETKDFIINELRIKNYLIDLKTIEMKPAKLPGMEYELRGYQVNGVEFIKIGRRVLLADEMGLGKTVMAIGSILQMNPKRVLIVCMNSLKFNWFNEIKMHSPSLFAETVVVQGSRKQRSEIYNSDKRIVIMNYELLDRDSDIMPEIWDYIIADEVSAIKNHKAKRTIALKKIKSNAVLGISGTPLENQIMDFHSIMEWVRPGLFGSEWEFKTRHVVFGFGGETVGYKNIPEVHEKSRPYVLRRKKDDVLKELPPKIKQRIYVPLSREEADLYRKWNKTIVESIDPQGTESRLWVQNVLTRMLRLKQIVDHPKILEEGYNGETSKLQALKDIISGTDEKVLVFTQFKTMAHILSKEFDAKVIEGAVPTQERFRIIDQFSADNSQVLVSTEAGAYGLTITAASNVIHYDLPWNPAKLAQREDRLHRISQKKTVNAYELVASKTIDEYIVEKLFVKLQTFDLVIEQMDNEEVVERQMIQPADIHAMLRMLPDGKN